MKPVIIAAAAGVVALGAYYMVTTQSEAPAPEQV